MEGASSFTDVPGWGLVIVGVTAVAVSPLAYAQPSAGRWLLAWLVEAVVAAVIAVAFIWRKARRRATAEDRPVFGIAARKFMLGLCPAILAGAVLTFALIDFETMWQSGTKVPRVIPGLWLLLYGVSVVTAGAYSVRAVPTMGIGFMLLGVAALFMHTLPGDFMLAMGFGVLHLIAGVFIAWRHGG